jgi:hypothetical protein
MVRAYKHNGQDSKKWEARAAACREVVATTTHPGMREKMLRLAADCEQRAEKARKKVQGP